MKNRTTYTYEEYKKDAYSYRNETRFTNICKPVHRKLKGKKKSLFSKTNLKVESRSERNIRRKTIMAHKTQANSVSLFTLTNILFICIYLSDAIERLHS